MTRVSSSNQGNSSQYTQSSKTNQSFKTKGRYAHKKNCCSPLTNLFKRIISFFKNLRTKKSSSTKIRASSPKPAPKKPHADLKTKTPDRPSLSTEEKQDLRDRIIRIYANQNDKDFAETLRGRNFDETEIQDILYSEERVDAICKIIKSISNAYRIEANQEVSERVRKKLSASESSKEDRSSIPTSSFATTTSAEPKTTSYLSTAEKPLVEIQTPALSAAEKQELRKIAIPLYANYDDERFAAKLRESKFDEAEIQDILKSEDRVNALCKFIQSPSRLYLLRASPEIASRVQQKLKSSENESPSEPIPSFPTISSEPKVAGFALASDEPKARDAENPVLVPTIPSSTSISPDLQETTGTIFRKVLESCTGHAREESTNLSSISTNSQPKVSLQPESTSKTYEVSEELLDTLRRGVELSNEDLGNNLRWYFKFSDQQVEAAIVGPERIATLVQAYGEFEDDLFTMSKAPRDLIQKAKAQYQKENAIARSGQESISSSPTISSEPKAASETPETTSSSYKVHAEFLSTMRQNAFKSDEYLGDLLKRYYGFTPPQVAAALVGPERIKALAVDYSMIKDDLYNEAAPKDLIDKAKALYESTVI